MSSIRALATLRLCWPLVVALSGCGGGPTNPNQNQDMSPDLAGGGPGGCTLTISGAQTGTFPCYVQSSWASSNNTGAVAIAVNSSSPAITVGISRPGEPTTGTWTENDSGAQSGVSVTINTSGWLAVVGMSAPNQGS